MPESNQGPIGPSIDRAVGTPAQRGTALPAPSPDFQPIPGTGGTQIGRRGFLKMITPFGWVPEVLRKKGFTDLSREAEISLGKDVMIGGAGTLGKLGGFFDQHPAVVPPNSTGTPRPTGTPGATETARATFGVTPTSELTAPATPGATPTEQASASPTDTPETTASPEPSPTPEPADALRKTLDAWLNGEIQVDPKNRFQYLHGTAVVDMKFNITPDDLDSVNYGNHTPLSESNTISSQGFFLGTDEVYSQDGTKKYLVAYIGQEDGSRNRYFIPLNLGEITNQQRIYTLRYQNNVYPTNVKSSNQYSLTEFVGRVSHFDNSSVIFGIWQHEFSSQNVPASDRPLWDNEWNPGIKPQMTFAQNYVAWAAGLAEGSDLDRHPAPENFHINERLSAVDESNVLYVHGIENF